MPIYMKIDGVVGNVTEKPYVGWIEVDSAQLGANRHVTNATGRGVNREATAPAVSEIVVTKSLDAASTALFRLSLWGEGKKATIVFVKRGANNQNEAYLTIELENTLISNYSVSGAGGGAQGRPMESLSLNFTKIAYSTTAFDEKARTTLPQWDLATYRSN